jgi:YidC/Oxa1 family membrane protein insertase
MDFLTNPFIVALLFLYQVLGGSLVLAIVAFTILTRVITYPLNTAQIKSSRKMQELNPKLQQLKDKYKGDREKLAQAQMALYKEAGVNPMAGCLPLLIQMPILFGLYGAIYAALGSTPLQLIDLQHRLLIPSLSGLVPLQNQFLWMNLGQPDATFILPFLVVVTTWLQSKLTMPPSADPKDPSAAMSRNMTLIMPLMIGLLSLSFASGLSIYWVVSNVAGIAQFAMMGKIDWRNVFGRAPVAAPASVPAVDMSEAPRKRKSLPAAAERPAAPKVISGVNRKTRPGAPKTVARKPRVSKE